MFDPYRILNNLNEADDTAYLDTLQIYCNIAVF